MTITASYYRLLGLSDGCSMNDLKKAYRIKARQYHPDLNHNPGAADIFISITEAYEYLIRHMSGAQGGLGNKTNLSEQWEENIRQQARRRAEYYSRTKYANFVKSPTYKTTRIFDITTIIYGLVVSVLIIALDIYSYSWLKIHATTREEEPSFSFMVFF
jgi:hypothetical protein